VEQVKLKLQFEDRGYGLTHFVQRLELEVPLEIEAKGFEAHDGDRVNALLAPAWELVCQNEEEIKTYLARGLVKRFNEMRQKGEKHVPYESYETIRAKLTNIFRITFYHTGTFVIAYWISFNDTKYQVYVSVNTGDLTFKNAGILTMGGFMPPKNQKKLNLKTAAALYAYHIGNGNTPDLYKHYAALPAKEIAAYIDVFIADDANIKDRIDCLLYLALFSYNCGDKLPDKLYRFLLDNEVFYYGEIYLRADEKFADELIAAFGTVDDEEAYTLPVNHILCALAAIPCKRTNDFLLRSSEPPLPIWARRLHIFPKDYAHVGGWETSDDGIPKLLFDRLVTAFEQCEKTDASPKSPVVALSEICGLCGQPLTLVFDGEQKLAACLYCSCYQTIYTKTREVLWHEKNTPGDFFQRHPEYMKNDKEITARFTHGIRPTDEKRQAAWTANEFAYITRTQIGGMPTAINDMDYPKCPDCGKTMRFKAQFDMADIEDGEGLYYFFVCEDCGVTAANYGQS
jgi:hypothetical protein